MKKVLSNICLFIIFLILGMTDVKANTVNNIEMDVYIDKNGNASITEVWDANLTEGTEGYRPYTNLGYSEIANFSVIDETGTTYTSLSNWNTSASFDSKAYKSGINIIDNGVELCWGISRYGNKTYTLNYDISNFVNQYTDVQGIYFNFINLDQSVGNATITIHSDIPFSLDNSRIWAFGNNGTINFEDGSIVLKSGGRLSTSQYMVALVRFEDKLFNTSINSSKSFDDVYESAMNGVNDVDIDAGFNLDFKGIVWVIIISILIIILNPLSIILIFLILAKTKGSQWTFGTMKFSGRLDFGNYGKIIPTEDKINYWREIPCNKDLERAYWVAYQYNVVSSSTLKEGIIGAILLRWIKDGLITVTKTKKGLFSFKDNNYAIDLSKITSAPNEIENNLLTILKKAAGINNVLEAKELKKWCKKNYGKMQKWFEEINKLEQKELEKQGLIYEVQEETSAMFGRTKIITVKKVSDELREDAIHLVGLKKFLLAFSLMPEREYFQVHIWEEYLIFAQILGIADKVEEQFSKLYPKFSDESKLNLDITTVAIRNMAHLSYSGMEDGFEKYLARSRAKSYSRYSGSDRDSGGGGSSYSSGGSSSGGSSGGGFR